MADTAAATNPPASDAAAKHKRTTSTAVVGVYTAAELGGLTAHLSPLLMALHFPSLLVSFKHTTCHTISLIIHIFLVFFLTNIKDPPVSNN